MDGSWQARVEQGYGPLIAFLAEQVQTAHGRLLLDTRVNRVDWQPGKVEVLATQSGRTMKLEADAAVLTLPLGVWKAGTVSLRRLRVFEDEAAAVRNFSQKSRKVFKRMEFRLMIEFDSGPFQKRRSLEIFSCEPKFIRQPGIPLQ